MNRPGSWMDRLAEKMDVTGEILPGLPLVEICGEKRVLIENHQGVRRYGTELICVGVSFGEVAVRGRGLKLARMTKAQLVISGCIEEISLVRRDGK